MKVFIFIITTFFIFSSSIIAQKGKNKNEPKHHGITDKKMWHTTKIANEQVKQKSYYNAVDNYHKVYDSLPTNEYILFQMAHAYYKGRDYQNAEKYYLELVTTHKKTQFGMAWFELAETFKYNGKYIAAQKAFSKFRRVKSREIEIKTAKKWARNGKNYCQYAIVASQADTLFFDTEVLPTEINSGYTDFSPTALGNDTIYFASLRKDSIVKYKHGEDAIFNINIYESVRSEDNTWSTAEIKSELSEEFDHVANGVFGPNNKFYYTKCYQDPHNEFICSIYSRKILDNGQLDKHEHKLPGKINKNHYTSTQPTFGRFYKRKGKAKIWYDVMYYATNRPGGYGGMDIWYSVIDNGKFSAPVNCKKSVNTIRDEITPFYNQAEQKLYFSSNYRYGLGGFDIFSSEGKLKRFRQTENLGMPFNSSYDDTYFVPTLDTVNGTNIGYLVSNRPGGFALASETCCDDIYRFESYIPDSVTIDILITELVLTPDSTSNITASTDSNFVATSKVETIGSIGLSGARVGYMKKYKYDKMMKEDSTLTATAFDALVTWVDTTSAEGKTKTSFLADKDYVILIEKEGFKDTIIDIDETKNTAQFGFEREVIDTLETHETLEPEVHALTAKVSEEDLGKETKFILEHMYFEYNMAKVKPEAEESVELLYNFLTENKGVKIEIAGHTDSKGNEDYNQELSQKRAESVRNIMIDKGIAPNRMTAKGYGESQPIAPNEKADGSDNPKGRRLNRRTEITILSNKKNR